jgi:hypothetical protein
MLYLSNLIQQQSLNFSITIPLQTYNLNYNSANFWFESKNKESVKYLFNLDLNLIIRIIKHF